MEAGGLETSSCYTLTNFKMYDGVVYWLAWLLAFCLLGPCVTLLGPVSRRRKVLRVAARLRVSETGFFVTPPNPTWQHLGATTGSWAGGMLRKAPVRNGEEDADSQEHLR